MRTGCPVRDSADYAAVRALADVLTSQRGNLYALVTQGKVLAAEFGMSETYAKASMGYSLAALPAGSDPSAVLAEMKKILAAYASSGVPADLVEAAKRRELASAEFQRNSIPGLAATWSQALAAEGRLSPDQDVAAIQAVKLEDVNRIARQYLREQGVGRCDFDARVRGRARGFEGLRGKREADIRANQSRPSPRLG